MGFVQDSQWNICDLCVKLGDPSSICFWDVVRIDRQTDKFRRKPYPATAFGVVIIIISISSSSNTTNTFCVLCCCWPNDHVMQIFSMVCSESFDESIWCCCVDDNRWWWVFTGPPTQSVGGETSAALWRLLSSSSVTLHGGPVKFCLVRRHLVLQSSRICFAWY